MSDIVIIAGSSNKNLDHSNQFHKCLEKMNVSSEVINLVSLEIPLYTTLEESKGIPEKVYELVKQFNQAKGFVFVIPEYNGGVPPVVTSMIAWISRGGGSDWRSSFNDKPVAIATFSGGGGVPALVSLRTQLSYIGMNVLGRQVRATFKEELNMDDLEGVSKALVRSIR